METVLYVTLEVTLKDGVDPNEVKDNMECIVTHSGIKDSAIVDVELGE